MLKIINCTIVLLILCGGFQSMNGETLERKFGDFNFFGTMYYTCYISLSNCELIQRKSMEFNLTCEYKKYNDEYSCETRDLTIDRKGMKLDKVFGIHRRFKINRDVTELIIVKSSMSYLSDDIFKPFHALQTLRIHNGQLKQLTKGDFHSASKLTVLKVNGNNIESLGDDVFEGAEEHLTEIVMSSNKIEKLSAGTFHGLNQLKVLSLKDNLITELQLETFKDVVMLEILILTGNKIKFLHGKMLEFNRRLMKLAVDHNELREVGEEILNYSVMFKDVNLEGNNCIDENTTVDDDSTDGRTRNELIFVIKNCCNNLAKALNGYNCGQSG